MDLDHLSYSSITSYLDCPENWRRHYLEKEPTATSPALVFGSAFHNAIEQMVDRPANLDLGTLDILNIWGSSWTKATEGQNIFWGTDTPEGIYNDGVRMFSNSALLQAVSEIHPMIDAQGPRIERKVELHVPGVPIPVIGYIDIQLEDETPADIKTAARAWSDDKAADSLQSLFYLAALNQAGEKINWKFKHIVFVKTKEPKIQILEHSHAPGELFFLFKLIKGVWDSIDARAFPMNPGTWKCNPKYCDYWGACRGKYQ